MCLFLLTDCCGWEMSSHSSPMSLLEPLGPIAGIQGGKGHPTPNGEGVPPSRKPRMCRDCHKGGFPLCDSPGTGGVRVWAGPPPLGVGCPFPPLIQGTTGISSGGCQGPPGSAQEALRGFSNHWICWIFGIFWIFWSLLQQSARDLQSSKSPHHMPQGIRGFEG